MSFGSLIYRERRSVEREKVIEVKVCPVCGKKFEATKRNNKYCSTACSFEAEYGGKIKGRQDKGVAKCQTTSKNLNS